MALHRSLAGLPLPFCLPVRCGDVPNLTPTQYILDSSVPVPTMTGLSWDRAAVLSRWPVDLHSMLGPAFSLGHPGSSVGLPVGLYVNMPSPCLSLIKTQTSPTKTFVQPLIKLNHTRHSLPIPRPRRER